MAARKLKPEVNERGEFLNKAELVSKTEKELQKNYKNMSEERKRLAEPLITTAAALIVSCAELESIIAIKKYSEEYQNGENQKGIKKCSEVDTYNNFVKNKLAYINKLDDMLEEKSAKSAKSDELLAFISGANKT